MPPKKIRVIPRNASRPVDHKPQPAQPEGATMTIAQRLRDRTSYLNASELAEVLNYDNPKRVYELPIRKIPLGPGATGAIRWDPMDVADYLDGRARVA